MASVTRGALYHHFADKKDLFEAVFRQVFDEVQKRTNAAAAAQPGDLWDKTVAATVSNLQIRADDLEAQRILMVEGPAVLGWERWRALQEGVLEDFTGTIRKLMDQGRIAQGPARALAGQIIAALVDAALSIAHSDDHSTELETQREAFLALFEGLQTKA